jgi:hypothetical protein
MLHPEHWMLLVDGRSISLFFLRCIAAVGSVSDPAACFHRIQVKKALFLARLGDVNQGKFGDAALGRPRATLGSRPRMGRIRAR